ncbi:ABC transporter ATP-binding protein [Salinarchaeum chitinilyticum]
MVELRLENVTKEFGSETAVSDLSLAADGDLLVLVGPSGCGKSTTLRMIAGLERPTSGKITIGGEDVTRRSPSDRSIAMVFQNYALYRTMNVRENIGYGLKHSSSLSKADRVDKVEEIAEMFDISELLNREISALSGGQKQRVALGRALVRDPDVFLLDEPLSSLDAKLRSQMRTELQRIQQELGVTTIYVTHDQKEAMTMGDRLAVMNDGELQQIGTPEATYDRPDNRFVASFLGSPPMNFLGVNIERRDGETSCLLDGHELVRLADGVQAIDRPVQLGIRPEDLALLDEPDNGTTTGTIGHVEYQGNDSFVQVEVGGRTVTCVVPANARPRQGDSVGLNFPPAQIHLFDMDTGDAIRSPPDPTETRAAPDTSQSERDGAESRSANR